MTMKTFRLVPEPARLDRAEDVVRWFENALGLTRPRLHHLERISRYAAAITRADAPTYRDSMAADRWATAASLLFRRDQALLMGWKPDAAMQPHCLAPLAIIERQLTDTQPQGFDSEAERVSAICSRLALGLTLAPHPVELCDPADAWPALWQRLWSLVPTSHSPEQEPAAVPGALATAQSRAGSSITPLMPDASLGVFSARSRQAAVQAVAAMLAAQPDQIEATTILCEDPTTAAALDFHLYRLGLPTAGAHAAGAASAVEQVLPLALALCWEPVDPVLLLDLVTLPVGPIPRSCARDLAEALSEMPGLRSSAWDEVIAAATNAENDPEGQVRKRLDAWFEHPRVAHGVPAPVGLLGCRCALVAQWAASRAQTLEAGDLLRTGLERLAGQGALLRELIGTCGKDLSAPQLARLLDEVMQGSVSPALREAAGGPMVISSFADVPTTCRRLVWLGITTGAGQRAPWTADEIAQLRTAGFSADDGTGEIRARRRKELHGLRRISEQMLIVTTQPSADERPHPFWTGISLGLKAASAQPIAIETVVTGTALATPWGLSGRPSLIVPSQPLRAAWSVPSMLLIDRDQHSYSELHTRLACPVRWMFDKAASLKPGVHSRLPEHHQLRGTFAHAVLATVLDGAIPEPELAATRAGEVFDQRVGKDAAPFMAPGQAAQRAELRASVIAGARILSSALLAAGCTTASMEAPVEGVVDGWTLNGSIDCLGRGDKGRTAVIDIKLGSADDHRQDLAHGRAIQLAIYAAATKAPAPMVAYYIINQRLLLTPAASSLRGAKRDIQNIEVVPGAADIGTVWKNLTAALAAGDSWLQSPKKGSKAKSVVVPARPLQPPDQWPTGASIVLDDTAKGQSVCDYCEHAALCGKVMRT